MFQKLEEGVKRKSFFILQILFGVFMLIFSVFVLLSQFNLVEYSIFFSRSFVELLLIVFGVVLIVDSFKNRHLPERTLGLIIGIIILLFGTLPLFHSLGMLRFLPVILFLDVNIIVLAGLLLVSSVYLIVDRTLLLFY